jgi:hypothetical protein
MRLLVTSLVLLALAAAGASVSAAGGSRQQALYLDGVLTHAGTSGPGDDKVGHEQTGSGTLRDVGGRDVGRYSFTCRWMQILAGGDARERCTGWAQTADGRLLADGPSIRSDVIHTWKVRGVNGAYRGARGTLVTRDLTQTGSLVRISLTPRPRVVLRSAAIANPVANTAFAARANALCDKAAARLAALPPFPFSDFDASHPDRKLLPKVGGFFTGAHDPRPIQRELIAGLRALGAPSADAAGWATVLAAHTARVAVMNAQDKAALAADGPAFVKTLDEVDANDRRIALTALLFGAVRCAQ